MPPIQNSPRCLSRLRFLRYYELITTYLKKTNLLIALVATKIDLLNNDFSSLDQAQKIAAEKGWMFHKTSAKENIGVNELFESLICKFLNIPLLSTQPSPGTLHFHQDMKSPMPIKNDTRSSIIRPKYQIQVQPPDDLPTDGDGRAFISPRHVTNQDNSKGIEKQDKKKLDDSNDGGGLLSKICRLCCS